MNGIIFVSYQHNGYSFAMAISAGAGVLAYSIGLVPLSLAYARAVLVEHDFGETASRRTWDSDLACLRSMRLCLKSSTARPKNWRPAPSLSCAIEEGRPAILLGR